MTTDTTTSSYTVRRMHAREVESVRTLYRLCHPTWTEKAARYYTTEHETLVAVRSGGLVGYALLGTAGGHAIAADSGVHPDHRGRGLAFQLHDARMHRARARGYDYLVGATWDRNVAMVRLLDSLGFLPAQIVENHYPDNEPPDNDGRIYVRDLRSL